MRLRARTLWAVCFAFAMTSEQGCFQASATGVYAHANNNGTIATKSANASLGVSSSGGPWASASTSHIDTTGFVANESDSQALTQYLKQRRLPLVGAQVLRGPKGQREVVLYGYVGSDFGKSDAVTKASTYLKDPNVTIDNRIQVRPELLSSGTSAGTHQPGTSTGENNPDTSGYPGAEAYAQQQSEAQQYMQQQAGSAISPMTPLLMMGLMMALSAASGGTFSLGPGYGGNYYGPPPANPYSGFPTPGYPSSPPVYSPFGP